MSLPDPPEALDRLQAFIRPESRRASPCVDDWEPPSFGSYEELKAWLKDAVLTARMYEQFPDGRWTLELLLKEQEPGTTYRIRL